MAHVSIHGIPIECSDSQWEPVELGEITRSLNGAPRSTKRARKRDHRFTTDQGGLLLDEAEALRQLIAGDGHSWSFAATVANGGLHSSRKVIPTTATGTITSGVVNGKHGLGLSAADTSYISWALGLTGDYTFIFWRFLAGDDWHHYLLRGNALLGTDETWLDGNLTSDPGILYVSGSELTLECIAGDELLDELVALPYRVPDEWIPLLYAYHQSSTWGALPLVNASGPGVPSSGLTALGEVYAGRRVPMRESDGTFTTGEVFEFKLAGV